MLHTARTTISQTLSHRRGLPALAALAILTTVGVATAAIPAQDGTIKACYSTSNGSPRIVDEAVTCKTNERALTWNQRGQQGSQGLQGIQGERGLQGLPGADGADGADGTDGTDGAPGTTVTGGQVSPTAASTPPGCEDVRLATTNIHLDKPAILHVEASALATGHSAGRVAQLVVSINSAAGFGGELQGTGVPVGDGAGLVTIGGFMERFGVSPQTYAAGDYVLTLDGQAIGACTPAATDFQPGPARLAWFTAAPR